MNILVTDQGFQPDTQPPHYEPYQAGKHYTAHTALALPNTIEPHALQGQLDTIKHIRIPFPKFTDGRGFTLARQLRLLGYRGKLRAAGALLADQYANARQVGFDEIEISAELAARQPEHQWLAKADWPDYDYQTRLGAQRIMQ